MLLKKMILVLGVSTTLIAAAISPAQAHEGFRGGYRGGYHSGGYGWVAPLAIGGLIGYELSRPYYTPPPTVVYTQPQVIYTQPQVTYIQQTPGVPQAPEGYHYITITDPNCNCQKLALVAN